MIRLSLNAEILEKLDKRIYEFLKDNIDIMPMRLVKLIANYYTDARIRAKYYERLGVKMGTNTYPNLGMKIIPSEESICLEIGKNVSLGPNITFICCSSPNNGREIMELPYIKNKLVKSGRIIVEDEVWIGAGVTILPDIRIGKCAVIGAGSIVLEDIEPYCVYAGTPAKKIRNLKTGARKKN